MVRALVILLLLCSLSGTARAQNVALPTDLAAQTADGTIWGAVRDTEGTVFHWSSGRWQSQSVPEAKGFVPQAITRGADGAVYVLWHPRQVDANAPSQVLLVSACRGTAVSVLARFPAPTLAGIASNSTPAVWSGPKGDVWVADAQATLWHVVSPEQARPFPLRPEWLRGDANPAGYSSPVWTRSLEDGQGRRWFWQEGASWGSRPLRGVLIWDGQQMSYRATLLGLPDHPFSTLERRDGGRLWVALATYVTPSGSVTPGGLYLLDTRTLTASPVPAPERDGFSNVTQLLRAGADWYAYGQPQYTAILPTLWRLRCGVWTKRLTGADVQNVFWGQDFRRPWLATQAGLWLGVREGAWFVPAAAGAATRVDWRRGLRLSSVTHFFSVPGGLLAMGTGGDITARLPPFPPPVLPLPPGLMAESGGLRHGLWSLIADPHRHLWGMGTDWSHGFPLDEWDGVQWLTHAAPETVAGVDGIVASDTSGRIWLAAHVSPPPPASPVDSVAVYDPARDTWTPYASRADALQAAAPLGVTLLPAKNVSLSVVLSGDGRAAYVEGQTIALFNGHGWHGWHRWRAEEIEAGYANLSGPLDLGRNGSLKLWLNGRYREWTAEGGWKKLPHRRISPRRPCLQAARQG